MFVAATEQEAIQLAAAKDGIQPESYKGKLA
jgi:hypothetical protein